MAFRSSRKAPQFADLKSILAQTKDTDNALYQVVQEIIERLGRFDFSTVDTSTGGSGGGGGGGNETYLTKVDETASLPNSRQLLARYGLKTTDNSSQRIVDLDLEYLGDHIPATTYTDGDIVVGPDQVAYICVKPTNATPIPWPGVGIISSVGPAGPPGPKGDKGDKGDPGSGAVVDAKYWVVEPHAGLASERALSLLPNGYVKSTVGEPSTVGIIPLVDGGTGNSLTINPAGFVLLSNGTNVVFNSGVAISQLNASNLSTGLVPIPRLPPNIAYKDQVNVFTSSNDFQGYVTFSNTSGPNSPTIVTANPALNFFDAAASANQHYHRILIQGGSFAFQQLNDGYTIPITYFTASQFGLVVGPTGTNPIYADGSPLINLNASQLVSGIVPLGRLGTNAPSISTFLRGDNTWQPLPDTSIPSGLIAMFSTNCPVGWTRVAGLDNRFPLGSTSFGTIGGSIQHLHGIGDRNTNATGNHTHSFSATGSGSGTGNGSAVGQISNLSQPPNTTENLAFDAGGSNRTISYAFHQHTVVIDVNIPVTTTVNVSVPVSGNTSNDGNHSHSVAIGDTDLGGVLQPYMTVVYCQKN